MNQETRCLAHGKKNMKERPPVWCELRHECERANLARRYEPVVARACEEGEADQFVALAREP